MKYLSIVLSLFLKQNQRTLESGLLLYKRCHTETPCYLSKLCKLMDLNYADSRDPFTLRIGSHELKLKAIVSIFLTPVKTDVYLSLRFESEICSRQLILSEALMAQLLSIS